MRPISKLVLTGLAVTIVAASLSPFIVSQSDNPCAGCHSNYYMYLDILEGDAGNILPTTLNETDTLTVTVAMKVTCNAPQHNVMSSIQGSLASQNGHFRVISNPASVGSLANGQTGKATWQIAALSSGPDMLLITAQGRSSHYNCQFTDSHSPSPSIVVTKAGVNLPPSISLTSPVPGDRLTGGADRTVGWNAQDEDTANCQVGLFYSTDDFKSSNQTLATGLPATQTYTWALPIMDSASVKLKASIVDPKGLYNETVMGGPITIDSSPPSITSVEPADKQKDVGGSAYIVVKFSEPVVESTAQAAFGISPDPQGLAWSWSADHATMTATHNVFGPGTRYTCSMSSGIKDRSNPGNVDQTPFSWSFTTPAVIIPRPSIALSAPSGGDGYYAGDKVQVRWSASGGTGALAVNLSISQNDTAGPFSPIAKDLPNTGGYSFNAPDAVSDTCVVEATVYDQNGMGSSTLSGDFSIAMGLALAATFPSGASPFLANDTVDVSWTATGGRGSVSLVVYFQPDANSTPQALASRLPRSGIYRWTAPELNTGSAMLILNATDGWNRSVANSSEPLTIKTKNPPPPPPPPPPPVKVNRAPVIIFDIREKRVMEKSLTTFDAAASFDPDGDAIYYIWDFGDDSGVINTTTPVVTHVFLGAGDYAVQLTVGDGNAEPFQTMMVRVDGASAPVAGTGTDWAMISFGIMVIIMGSVGTVYAAASRICKDDENVSGGNAATDGPSLRPTGNDAAPAPSDQVYQVEPNEPSDAVPADRAAPAAGAIQGPPPPLSFDRNACIGCGGCARRCANKAITLVNKRPSLEPDKCNGCGECVKKCVKGAISPNPAHRIQERGVEGR